MCRPESTRLRIWRLWVQVPPGAPQTQLVMVFASSPSEFMQKQCGILAATHRIEKETIHMTEEVQKKESLFGVIAEVKGRNKQLVLLTLTFGRLIDEIVKPYDTDEAFFIDGVPVKKTKSIA